MVQIDALTGLRADIALKAPCRVATTAAITLSGLQTIDGITVVAGDRVLVKDQAATTENGIYDASATAWSRSQDFDGNLDATDGTLVRVRAGTTAAGKTYGLTGTNPIVIGTSAIEFEVINMSATSSDIADFLASANDADARTELGLGDLSTLDTVTLAKMADLASGNIIVGNGSNRPEAQSGATAGLVPTGAVFWFAASSAPTGYLECSGDAISRATYATLFAVVGTVFGSGDGSTTFNLPDLRGEFVRGWDDGRGVDTGRAFGSTQADELKSHTHTTDSFDAATSGGLNSFGTYGNVPNGNKATNATGGAETRPRNVALLPCIKT